MHLPRVTMSRITSLKANFRFVVIAVWYNMWYWFMRWIRWKARIGGTFVCTLEFFILSKFIFYTLKSPKFEDTWKFPPGLLHLQYLIELILCFSMCILGNVLKLFTRKPLYSLSFICLRQNILAVGPVADELTQFDDGIHPGLNQRLLIWLKSIQNIWKKSTDCLITRVLFVKRNGWLWIMGRQRRCLIL